MKHCWNWKQWSHWRRIPLWFGNRIKLSWIIPGSADRLCHQSFTQGLSLVWPLHHWAQQIWLTPSAHLQMLSVFSLFHLECESASYSCRGPMTPRPLFSKRPEVSTLASPLRSDVKWTVFASTASNRNNMSSHGSKTSSNTVRLTTSSNSSNNNWQRSFIPIQRSDNYTIKLKQ